MKAPVGSFSWADLTVDNAEEIKDFYASVVEECIRETIIMINMGTSLMKVINYLMKKHISHFRKQLNPIL
jgi:predicted enzyme related to lactoylglutathione lyase